MASSFGGIDLTATIVRENGAIPLFSLRGDPAVITALAYGGVSVQDSYVRLSTLSVKLSFSSYTAYTAFAAKQMTSGTLVYHNKSFTNTTLNQLTAPVWGRDDRVDCTATFTRNGI